MRILAALALLLAACGPSAPTAVKATPTSAPPTSSAEQAVPSPATTSATGRPSASAGPVTLKEFPVPAGSGPHDVAPAADGGVWFTAQRRGQLGWLDPKTGQTKMIGLGAGSAPHGVIVDRDGVAWVTDGGQNAIVAVDPRADNKVTVFRLPASIPNVDLNTAAIDPRKVLWFTGQRGYFGRLVPGGVPEVFAAPGGAGPYGITTTPQGSVYYASLAGSHIASIVTKVGTEGPPPIPPFEAMPISPPTPSQGARRVWSDAAGMIWVSEWNAGQVGRYDPRTGQWKEWKLPNSTHPQAYAVFVDDKDIVWLSEWSSSSIVRFDPATETFTSFPHAANGGVRQLNGRPGEVWGALSALDKLIVLTTP